MKYRHFPAAVLAAGLLFCTLFSGFAAYADDKKGELTQNQTEARQEYEAEQAALNELKSAQAQTENEVAALTGQAAELAGQITDVAAAVQAAQTELDVRRTAAEAADATLTAKQAEYDARLALCKEQLRAMQRLDGDTREVIHLRLAGDFSFREIGDILGKSEVWARVRFYRGKEELAKLMGGGYGGKRSQ